MSRLITLYRLALKLYPRPFQERFTNEMLEVFSTGLQETNGPKERAGYLLREAWHLPGNLAGVYLWLLRQAKSRQMVASGAGGGMTGQPPPPVDGWRASLLAGLPHLLVILLAVTSALVANLPTVRQSLLSSIELIVFVLPVLAAFVYSLRKGWPGWSGSWLLYMFVSPILLLTQGINSLFPSVSHSYNLLNLIETIFLPLVSAYLLYRAACRDRLRGLLAAIPLSAVVWLNFQEFVPALPRTLAWVWLFGLAFAASVAILRTKHLSSGLWLAAAVPVLGGFPFAFLGVYLGGTLPSSQPGASLLEVFHQYLPFLALSLAILFGPQLAVKLRELGRSLPDWGGKIGYHLALGGVLFCLALTLLEWIARSSDPTRWTINLTTIRWTIFSLALLLYLAGFASLLRKGGSRVSLKLASLFVLLPGVPATIYLLLPSVALGRFAGWPVILIEAVWAAAAAWVAGSSVAPPMEHDADRQ